MSRVRSPAYPALSLSAAVDMIRKVHKEQQTTPEPRAVVLQHMGYNGENGRSLKSISALIKYGFLEKASDDGMRVSERAVSILFPDPDDPEKHRSELYQASREPQLFAEMFERWDTRPSEASVEAFLIRKGFNVNALDQVARAFFETFDLVSDFGDSYDSEEDLNVQDTPMETASMTEKPPQAASMSATLVTASPQAFANTGELALNTTKPIFDFATVKIITEIDNKEDLQTLIGRLNLILEMLPSKTGQD